MRRRIALLVTLVALPTIAPAVRAQDRLPTTLFSRCSAIRLEVILGRVTVIPRHRGQFRFATTHPAEGSEVRESLAVNNDADSPTIRYERSDGQQTLVVEVAADRALSIRYENPTEAKPRTFDFTQPARGKVRLVVRTGAEPREIVADGLWHLLLMDRHLGEETVVSILELLRPNWHLAAMSDRLEAELFRRAQTSRPVARREWEQLVTDLNAPQYRHRQLADRQLRSYGPAILPFLDDMSRQQGLAGRRLHAEQRDRLQRIRQSLSSESVDTPERVAQWLVDDEQTWLALLKHADPERRHLASIRLAALRPDAVPFDPYGDESYRQRQLAQLESQIRR